MTEAEFELTQERIDNVEAHCIALERDMVEYMDKNPKGTDQWMEARIRRLEAQIKELMDWKNGKGSETDSQCDVAHNVSQDNISNDIDFVDDKSG